MYRPRILFLCYHGKGHFNPCFPLAEILSVDHDVVFAGVEFFQEYVTSCGFTYYPLKTVPFGIGLEDWVNTVQHCTPVYLHTLKDRWRDRLYTAREEELAAMLQHIKPTLVLVDDRQSTDFIVLYAHLKKHGIRFGLLHAMPPAALMPGIPPINTTAFPDDTRGVRRVTRAVKVKRLKRLWRQKLLYLGMDDGAILRRRIWRNAIPRTFFSGKTIFYGCALQAIHELILMPQELNFPGMPVSPFHHYLGLLQRPPHAGATASDRYTKIRTLLQEEVALGKRCIYCSIGTVQPENTVYTQAFIGRLIDSIQGKPIVLILSLASLASASAAKYMDVTGVYIFDSVPQPDVLTYADLFITHGGLNSIKESIYAGVPLLVYPVDSILDPPGNAVRVAYHGLGLRGDLQHDTVEDIGHAIHTVLTDGRYKQSVLALREACRAYTPETIRRAISLCSVPE